MCVCMYVHRLYTKTIIIPSPTSCLLLLVGDVVVYCPRSLAFEQNTGRGCSSRSPSLFVPNSAHRWATDDMLVFVCISLTCCSTYSFTGTWYVTALPSVICYQVPGSMKNAACRSCHTRNLWQKTESSSAPQVCACGFRIPERTPADSVQQRQQQQQEHGGSYLSTHTYS